MFSEEAEEIIDRHFSYGISSSKNLFDKANLIQNVIEEHGSGTYFSKCPHKTYIINFFFDKLFEMIPKNGISEYGKEKVVEFRGNLSGDENGFEYDYEYDKLMNEQLWRIIQFLNNKYDLFNTGLRIQSLFHEKRRAKKGKFAVLFNRLIREFIKQEKGVEYIYLTKIERPRSFCQGNKYISWFFKKFLETFEDELTEKERRNYRLLYHIVSIQLISVFEIELEINNKVNHERIQRDLIRTKKLAKIFYQYCK